MAKNLVSPQGALSSSDEAKEGWAVLLFGCLFLAIGIFMMLLGLKETNSHMSVRIWAAGISIIAAGGIFCVAMGMVMLTVGRLRSS